MTKIKKILLVGLAFFSFCISAFPQTITTASEYFKSISDFYATLKDYEAYMEIRAAKQEMSAKVSYKKPNLMRIDFSSPENQVIVYNGDMLTIYLPESSAVLQQVVQSEKTGANMATAQGLSLMSRYYSVGYEVGQSPVALDSESSEMVMKLILYPRNRAAEAFTSIKIAINPQTKLIRRIQAFQKKGESITFNFTDYKLNQDLTDQRFIYDPPSDANNYNNFLFSE